MVVDAVNFHSISTISISYKSCDVYLSFDTLVRLPRPLVWPQRPRKVIDGKGKNHRKAWVKILDSSIFKLGRHAAPQKNHQIISNSDLK